MVTTSCTTEQKVKITAAPTTASGKPAKLDAPLRVSVQSGTGTFTQDPADFDSFFAVSGDAAGGTTYVVEAGDGASAISDTVQLTVTAEAAATLGLSAGSPEPK